jgi:serine/threonine protein kinase
MFLSPGAKLDKYEIVAPLAVGGMAELYIARTSGPQGFEKLCVVKRILTQHARDDEFVKMFLDEARLAATLRHPNVIQVYDVGSVKGRYYFAMEYVHGQDLASIVSTARANKRGLRVGNAVSVIVGAAAGLHHAHEQVGPDGAPLHIVHRDVSPANILVSYEGHVKVVDFGIAKAAARATRTTAAGFKGKLSYMSPEQVQARPDLDRRSDIFSLGVVLYELTTGKPLFRGDSDLRIAETIVEGNFARPSEARDGYDGKLEEIVMTALARDPAQRFPTALAMQLALEDYARASQLVLSSHPLGDFMRELFSTRVESWELAKRRGTSLAEFVRSTAELSALDVTTGDPPAPAPQRRPWWKSPSVIVGGAAVIAAIAGWGIVLANSSSENKVAIEPPPLPAPSTSTSPASDVSGRTSATGPNASDASGRTSASTSPASDVSGRTSISTSPASSPASDVSGRTSATGPNASDASGRTSASTSLASDVSDRTSSSNPSASDVSDRTSSSNPSVSDASGRTSSTSTSSAKREKGRRPATSTKTSSATKTSSPTAGSAKTSSSTAGTATSADDQPKSLDDTVNPFDVLKKQKKDKP